MALLGKLMSLSKEGRSVTGQRSNQLNYVPNFVFLPLSETRVFSGFPQVQSIRLRRLFQPLGTTYYKFWYSGNRDLDSPNQCVFSSSRDWRNRGLWYSHTGQQGIPVGLSRSRRNRGRKAAKIRGWERGLCDQPDANDKRGCEDRPRQTRIHIAGRTKRDNLVLVLNRPIIR